MISISHNLIAGGAERIKIYFVHEFARARYESTFVLQMHERGELLAEAQATFPSVSLAATRTHVIPLALAQYLCRRPDSLLEAMWLNPLNDLITPTDQKVEA